MQCFYASVCGMEAMEAMVTSNRISIAGHHTICSTSKESIMFVFVCYYHLLNTGEATLSTRENELLVTTRSPVLPKGVHKCCI